MLDLGNTVIPLPFILPLIAGLYLDWFIIETRSVGPMGSITILYKYPIVVVE